MNYQVYSYGRTYEKDFRTLCVPKESLVSKENLIQIENFVKEVLNTDRASNGKINPQEKRYSFMCFETFVLWGIGFTHAAESFSKCGLNGYVHDIKRRTGIRSFVGVVIDRNTWSSIDFLPYTDDFFYELYRKYVIPSWNFPEFQQWTPIISDIEYYNPVTTQCVSLHGIKQLNNDKRYCNFYSPADLWEILASLKTCQTNLITGLNVESHIETAANAKTPIFINNAICAETVVFHSTQVGYRISQEVIRLHVKSSNAEKEYIFRTDIIDVSSSVEWITLRQIGARKVRILIVANKAPEYRKGSVHVIIKNVKYEIIVEQDAHHPSKLEKVKKWLSRDKMTDPENIEQNNESLPNIHSTHSFISQLTKQEEVVDINNGHLSNLPSMTDQLLDWGSSWSEPKNDVDNTSKDIITESSLPKNEEEKITEYNMFSTLNEDSKMNEI